MCKKLIPYCSMNCIPFKIWPCDYLYDEIEAKETQDEKLSIAINCPFFVIKNGVDEADNGGLCEECITIYIYGQGKQKLF